MTEIQDGWNLEPDKEDPTGMVLRKTLWTDKLEGDKQGEFPVGKAVEAYEVPKAEAIVKANSGWGKDVGGGGWGKKREGGSGWGGSSGSGGWQKPAKVYPQWCFMCKRKTFMGNGICTNNEDNTKHIAIFQIAIHHI